MKLLWSTTSGGGRPGRKIPGRLPAGGACLCLLPQTRTSATIVVLLCVGIPGIYFCFSVSFFLRKYVVCNFSGDEAVLGGTFSITRLATFTCLGYHRDTITAVDKLRKTPMTKAGRRRQIEEKKFLPTSRQTIHATRAANCCRCFECGYVWISFFSFTRQVCRVWRVREGRR